MWCIQYNGFMIANNYDYDANFKDWLKGNASDWLLAMTIDYRINESDQNSAIVQW